MPNWCNNTLYITGAAVEATVIRTLMTTSKSRFDFNAIVPMPDEIEKSEPSFPAEIAWQLKYGDWRDATVAYCLGCFPSREAAMQAAREADYWVSTAAHARDNLVPATPTRSVDELADSVQGLIIKYGHADWYSWACANWGSKWAAVDASWMSPARAAKQEAHQVVCFNTAWGPPIPVITKLSKHFPSVILRLAYYGDEFDGFVAFQAGVTIACKNDDYELQEPGGGNAAE